MSPLPFDIVTGEAPYRVAAYPPGATFGPRTLRDWEFVWLLEGDAEYTRDNETIAAPEGALVLCRPGAVDAFRWDPARRTRHAYFHFDIVGAFPSYWPSPDSWPIVRRTDGSDPGRLLAALFHHLITRGNQGDAVQVRLIALSLLAAFVTASDAAASPADASIPEVVSLVQTYIVQQLDRNPATPISLGEMAAVACVTPQYLCRLFRRTTGRTPAETVVANRLAHAHTLLLRSNYTVAEIADLCGFASPFHFSRRFKAAYGVSPRTLRQSVAPYSA